MELFYSVTSPYARKVRVLIIERGLEDKVALTVLNPRAEGAEKTLPNPVGTIPALMTEAHGPIYDSPVICAYLDELGEAAPLIPSEGAAKWAGLRAHALADGLVDRAFALVMERLRDDTQPSAYWMARWADKIGTSVAAMADDIATGEGSFDMRAIAYGCALGYLDFRLPEIPWRDDHPGLAAWYDKVAARRSFQETVPQ